jgi:hypothetical protein
LTNYKKSFLQQQKIIFLTKYQNIVFFQQKTAFQQKMAFLLPKIIFLTIKNHFSDNTSFFEQKIPFSAKKRLFFIKKICRSLISSKNHFFSKQK